MDNNFLIESNNEIYSIGSFDFNYDNNVDNKKEKLLADSSILISAHWENHLPVITKSGKLSFHRKGYRQGKYKTKQNPYWNNDYIKNKCIYLENPKNYTRNELLSMTVDDWKEPGFWFNPYGLEFLLNCPNHASRAELYYKWLYRSPEGALRLACLSKLRNYYLVTSDLLRTPNLGVNGNIYHYGQVLLCLACPYFGVISNRKESLFNFVCEIENDKVSYNPSFLTVLYFLCNQMGIMFDELIRIYKASGMEEKAYELISLSCYDHEVPF